jgi:hypothetical protein
MLVLVLRSLARRLRTQESGFSTAELLGNAALGIAALVVIWGLLSTVGAGVMSYISSALGVG